MNSADVQNLSASSDDMGKFVEPMEVENVVESDANIEPTVETKTGYEQEIQSYAADESDVVAEVAIRSPIVKVETPKSVRKLPKSAKKSSTKKADSSIPIEVENPQTVEEDNEEASSNLEAVDNK